MMLMDFMLMDFLLLAWIAGLGVAAVGGPLGCFIVWRRMAYFGDTLAHGALLGLALGFLTQIHFTMSVIAVCIGIALIMLILQRNSWLAGDTLLGILSHGTLSLGLVVLSFMSGLRMDLMGYLFGDILAVSVVDILWIYGGGGAVLLILWKIWTPLLTITIHEDLARAEGIPVDRVKLVFMLLIALVIAVSMKIVGILLITSLLIIPPATARNLTRSPESMAIGAALIGMLAISGGLWVSSLWDIPSGPSIVVTATSLFLISFVRVRR